MLLQKLPVIILDLKIQDVLLLPAFGERIDQSADLLQPKINLLVLDPVVGPLVQNIPACLEICPAGLRKCDALFFGPFSPPWLPVFLWSLWGAPPGRPWSCGQAGSFRPGPDYRLR